MRFESGRFYEIQGLCGTVLSDSRPLHPDGYGYSNYFNYDETAFGDLYNDFIINNGQLHERSTYVGCISLPMR